MDHVIDDETQQPEPILMAPLVTIATTLALVIVTALLGR